MNDFQNILNSIHKICLLGFCLIHMYQVGSLALVQPEWDVYVEYVWHPSFDLDM